MVILLLDVLLELPLARQAQDVVLQGDLDVFLGQPGQLRLELVAVLGLLDVHRRHPAPVGDVLALQIADSRSLKGVAVGGLFDDFWKQKLGLDKTKAHIVLGYLVGK